MTRARICLVYDCLFPWTIGGAERWYRNLGERLAEAGHDVTYLTLTQWDEFDPPCIPGVKVVAVGPRMPLYADGKRRILPPLRFGLGVLGHLLRHRRDYDWVHTASFPYFSLLAAGLVRPFASYRVAVDWHEVWSRDYWREYLGALGFVGAVVQRLCALIPQTAYTFSQLHQDRLAKLGIADVSRLTGEYAGGEHKTQPSAEEPATIVYAGRFIPEKRLELLIDALAIAMDDDRSLRAVLYGDGPDLRRIKAKAEALGLGNRVEFPGFVETEHLERAMSAAAAIVQPSAREGYGMIVVEASARGVPVVVVRAPDNAATELVEDGCNGFAVAEAEPALLAQAIRSCIVGGPSLRNSARRWYSRNRERLSLQASLDRVAANYSVSDDVRTVSSEKAVFSLKSGVA